MTLPHLPTDNLYKFLSIFGLVLFVFGAYLYNTKPNEIYLKIDDYNIKNEILKTNTKKDSVLNLRQELVNEKIKLNVIEKQINRDIKRLSKELKKYLIISILGIIMIGFGFLKWYYKTQYYNDKILKNESENLKNNKETSIHKIQFEKEFLIYNELWKNLIGLRNYTSSLRPQFDIIDPKESEEERKKSRLEKFNIAFTDCVNTFDNNKPFYPKEIYDEIDKTIRLARKEVREYNRGEKYSKEYWENAEKNIEEIINSTNIVCEKIRQRIGLIKIEN
jgi:hypothetical protein